jgi:Ssu72-like protein
MGFCGGRVDGKVHVVNVEIRDTNEDSLVGAQHILEFVRMVSGLEDVDAMIETTINQFVRKTGCNLLYAVAFN